MDRFATSLLASLGLLEVTACGGKSTDARRVSDAGTDDAAMSSGGRAGKEGDVDASGGKAQPTGGSSGAAPSAGAMSGAPAAGGATGDAGDGGIESGTGGRRTPVCSVSSPVLDAKGRPTGMERCRGDTLHRAEALACASALPTSFVCPPEVQRDGSSSSCRTDADCTARPNGWCDLDSSWGAVSSCQCHYGCRTDDDCGSGYFCRCGSPAGTCVPSGCRTDADCAPRSANLLCLSYTGPCGSTIFACQRPGDRCESNDDCPGQYCTVTENLTRACVTKDRCVDGRPFLVGGIARVAEISSRPGWASELRPATEELDTEDRLAVGVHWTELALMEHASIAAFARFTLELLSLGAPPELLLSAQQAMHEETGHARDAFALASAYLDRPIGPGALNVDGALVARSPLEIVRSTILEGCIGETIAALEATEALRVATDPAVRAALSRVVVEETRHAELAYRFVLWVLRHGPPELADATAEELVQTCERQARIARATPLPPPDRRATLLAHGVLDDATRLEIRARALAEIVAPCARVLGASRDRARRRVESSSATFGLS